ncbi:MAG: hypothetical protein GQ565_07030 [Candidatus Aegiribacteria sp.]|nr:hypothetical protein [Candidatus Aegiribacteria sp.]
MKYVSLAISIGITLMTFGISGCLTDPYSVGEPDSLFSEYVLVWDLMDSHYACFFAKENVNWDELYQKYRGAANNLRSRDELVDLCLQLLGELSDQNLALRNSAGARMESWNQGHFVNWDLNVWQDYMLEWSPSSYVEELKPSGARVFFPTSTDTVGYVYISDMGKGFGDWRAFYDTTEVINCCSGLILDLRMCGCSGYEMNAFYTCGRFVDERLLGFYRAFRAGSGRNDMGEMLPVWACRNGAWQFTKPIVLLTGRYTQGAAEQMVLLLKTQQHVTVIGDTTAGFANTAVSFNLTEGWTIEIPSLVTYSPDSTLILNSGIAPEIYVPVSEADFAAGIDPVLDAALEMILQ